VDASLWLAGILAPVVCRDPPFGVLLPVIMTRCVAYYDNLSSREKVRDP
jgi:hypothetical protein